MSKPIIHIGYHKTATTWFQKRFYPLVENYRYVPRRAVQEAILETSALQFSPERALERLAEEDDGRPLLLCEEELSGNPHSAGMRGAFSKDVAGRLRAIFDNPTIVVFIRNQVEMAAALYRNYVREGGTYRPRRYFFPEQYRKDIARHPFKYPVFSFDHLDYGGLLAYYAELFGRKNVHVFSYEAFREEPGKFANELGARLGLRLDTAGLAFSRENEGDASRSLALTRLLNRLSYRNVLDKRWCLNLLSNKLRSQPRRWLNGTVLGGPIPDAETLLGPELVETIRQRFAHSNGRLAEDWGLPLGRLGYPGLA